METVPDTFPSLFAGYTVLWALVVIYVLTLARRVKRIERLMSQPVPNRES